MKKITNPAMVLLALVLPFLLPAQSNTETLPPVTHTFALTNVNIVQKPGQLIEQGTVIIKDGLIYRVGKQVDIPSNARILEADSMYVYAGFIDGLSHTGISKPEKKAGPQPKVKNPGEPSNELAGIQPETQLRDVLNPKDKSIAEMRKLGFTAAQAVPRGKMLPGSSALILLNGSTADEMILRGQTVLFSQLMGASRVYPATVIGVMSKWRELYKQAMQAKDHEKAYSLNPAGMKRPAYDRTLQAFYPVIEGGQAVLFKAEDVKSVSRVFALRKELGFPLVLANLKQGWHVTEQIKSSGTPVFLSLDLPKSKDKKDKSKKKEKGAKEEEKTEAGEAEAKEPKDMEKEMLEKRRDEELKKYHSQAATFEQQGIAFGFSTITAKSKDIRGNLRIMIENGLSEQAALAALTTNPARQLGLSKVLGTVEPGKIANLVVTDKPYFEEKSNVRYVFVDGDLFEYEVKKPKKKTEGDSGAVVKLAGTWSYTIDIPGQSMEGTFTLNEENDEISGIISNPQSGETTDIENVEANGNELSFSFSFDAGGQMMTVEYNLIINGDSFDGTVTAGDFGTFDVEGDRQADPDR